MSKQQGFSLIELLITVVIISIITSIALPSYQEHVKRSHRTDATAALLLVAAEQEKFYLANNAYTTTLSDLGIDGTQEGYYTLEITSSDLTTQFVATATPKSGEPPASDGKCTEFSLDSAGTRRALKDSTDNTSYCW